MRNLRTEGKLIVLPDTYKSGGSKNVTNRSKGYNKVKFLYESGLYDFEAIKKMIVAHYYALSYDKNFRGWKHRSQTMSNRISKLKKAIEEFKKDSGI